MYIPAIHRETDPDALIALMERHPFATLLSVHEGEPAVTPLPITIERHGDTATLSGHLARANPQWRGFGPGRPAQLLFHGPHAYISPALYDSEQSVPTWNYALVIAHGVPEIVEDEGEGYRLLERLIERFEASYLERWQGLSERYRSGMLRGIVPFTMRVERLEGKFKLSQNKSEGERGRIVEWLMEGGGDLERGVGEMMERSTSP